jgi:hypothetical protein
MKSYHLIGKNLIGLQKPMDMQEYSTEETSIMGANALNSIFFA